MKFLKKVIDFRMALLGERTGFKGTKGIVELLLIVIALLIGLKSLICFTGHYGSVVMIITIFAMFSCDEFIFPKKIKEKCNTVSIFFESINYKKYYNYLNYRGFIYFQLLYFFILFPISSGDLSLFLIANTVFQTYIFIISFLHYYTDSQFYSSVKYLISFSICALYFINNRFEYIDLLSIKLNSKICVLLISLSIMELVLSFKKLGEKTPNKSLRKIKSSLFMKNKDIIYVMRSDVLFRPTVICLFSGILSFVLKEKLEDMIITNLFSFFFIYSEIYLNLLKYENKRYSLVYSDINLRRFKREKILNTLFVAVPVIIVISIPLSFVTSIMSVIISFFASLILFLFNSIVIKMSIDKKIGYSMVLSEHDELVWLIVSIIELFSLCIVQVMCMN